MCAGAVVLARVDRLVFGAWNDEMGAVGTLWDVVRDRRLNHRPEVVSGVLADECGRLLQEFFAGHRDSDGTATDRVISAAVACPSGRRSTPRKRVRGQLLRGFKSHRHRHTTPGSRRAEDRRVVPRCGMSGRDRGGTDVTHPQPYWPAKPARCRPVEVMEA